MGNDKIVHKTKKIKKKNVVEFVYLCNNAIKGKYNKMSPDWKEVTCKNCLKQKPKDEDKTDTFPYEQVMKRRIELLKKHEVVQKEQTKYRKQAQRIRDELNALDRYALIEKKDETE